MKICIDLFTFGFSVCIPTEQPKNFFFKENRFKGICQMFVSYLHVYNINIYNSNSSTNVTKKKLHLLREFELSFTTSHVHKIFVNVTIISLFYVSLQRFRFAVHAILF